MSMKQLINNIRHPITKRQRIMRAASLWAFVTLMFLVLRLVYLSFGVGIPCPLFVTTGLFCPGCGIFRAANALLQGEIWQAIRFNALIVVLPPTLLVLCCRETIKYIWAIKPKTTSRAELLISVGAAAISILYAIARNLPFLASLQPTNL